MTRPETEPSRRLAATALMLSLVDPALLVLICVTCFLFGNGSAPSHLRVLVAFVVLLLTVSTVVSPLAAVVVGAIALARMRRSPGAQAGADVALAGLALGLLQAMLLATAVVWLCLNGKLVATRATHLGRPDSVATDVTPACILGGRGWQA